MNTIVTTPDVKLFVRAVREHLADLSEEEREELVGGLEGDMSDLVEERGVDALPEPSAYARELRAAAGFAPEGEARARRGRRDRVMAWMDRGTTTWGDWSHTGDHLRLPAFATALQPVWWLLRGLCAAALACEIWGAQDIYGFTSGRALVAGVAVLGSIALGLWWPASSVRRSLLLRLALVALNALAVLMIPTTVDRFFVAQSWLYDYADDSTVASETDPLWFNGEPVRNVYPYDAQGHALTGVQLVDQDGRRLMVEGMPTDPQSGDVTLLTPWMNGRTQLFSVYPLPERPAVDTNADLPEDAQLQTPPYASLPPVTLAGVTPSVLQPATATPTAKAPAQKTATAKKRNR